MGMKYYVFVTFTMNNNCEIVRESLVKVDSSAMILVYPWKILKTFCFGLPGWCHCCIVRNEGRKFHYKAATS